MNTVTVEVWINGFLERTFPTKDVNEAMAIVHESWHRGRTVVFAGPFGFRTLEPPIEDLVSQLEDDSQARHDRNRARQKLP